MHTHERAAPPARSLAALEAGADAADEVKQLEALRLRVRLALGDGQRVACAVEVAEGAAQPARVALPPVDDVEACWTVDTVVVSMATIKVALAAWAV